MGVIATLLPNSEHAERLRVALRGRHDIVACDDWSSLERVCESRGAHLAFVDLYAGGRASFDRIRRLKHRLPRLTLIAYVTPIAEQGYDLFDAGRQGMDGLVLADQHDTSRRLLALVEQAESRSLGAVVGQSLQGVDALARDALLVAVTRAHERLTSIELARVLGVARRTMSARLIRAGFPTAQRLLTWGRLIVAAHLLEDRQRSAQHVAAALEFPSGSAFRNTCQRYLHATPQEIRSRGGAAYVIRVMLKQLQTTSSSRGTRAGGKPRRARNLALAI